MVASSPISPSKRPMRKQDTKKKLMVETFNRMPMITVKDDMRDCIESNVSTLVGTVADSINRQISLVKEEENKARKLNIKTPIVSSLTSLGGDTEELDEFEKLGDISDRGGVNSEHREEFMQRLEIKQVKRAEEAEKRERIASAKKKK